jgi:amino acid transporter
LATCTFAVYAVMTVSRFLLVHLKIPTQYAPI